MQFEMGYYHNRNGEIVYLFLIATDLKTNEEVAVYTDSNESHWTETKKEWVKRYRRCDNQLNACQLFQNKKLSCYTFHQK